MENNRVENTNQNLNTYYSRYSQRTSKIQETCRPLTQQNLVLLRFKASLCRTPTNAEWIKRESNKTDRLQEREINSSDEKKQTTWRNITFIGVISLLIGAIGLFSDVVGVFEQFGIQIVPRYIFQEKLQGDFRVAVLTFVGSDLENDSLDDITSELAEIVYKKISHRFENQKPDFTFEIASPSNTPYIRGSTSDDWVRSIEQIANSLDADLIVYGVVQQVEDAWNVTPAFYVSSPNFHDAHEITGQHAFGAAISFNVNKNLAGRLKFSNEFADRVESLSYLIFGLAYYSLHDYSESLQYLQIADGIMSETTGVGLKVINLIEGNAALKLGEIELAESYYQKSLDIDKLYTRAHVGIANVYYLDSLTLFNSTENSSNINTDLLIAAREKLAQAALAPEMPKLADIPSKIHFLLGQIELATLLANSNGDHDKAVKEFEIVVSNYGNGTNLRIRNIAAESHARLGLIYAMNNDLNKAIEEYQMAANLTTEPIRQQRFEERVKTLREEQRVLTPIPR